MGVTTIPLPAFWSSSKNDIDQFRRSPRKEHLCQNPRCAANDMACDTPHNETPTKPIKGSFKKVTPRNSCPAFANRTRTELENCGSIKGNCSYAEKYADCKVVSPPRLTVKPLRESYSVNAHKGSTGIGSQESTKFPGINCKEATRLTGINYKESTRLARVNCRESIRLTGINSKESTRLTGIDSKESSRLTGIDSKESIRLTGIDSNKSIRSSGINPKQPTRLTGDNSKESKRSTGIKVKEFPRSARLYSKEFARSTEVDSKESTTSISSSSHAPSISTPRRSPPKPTKIGLSALSVQKESTSTGSSSPGYSQGTTLSVPPYGLSESMDIYIADENLTPSFVISGGIAPPNSERGEEEMPPNEEIERIRSSLPLPHVYGLPVGSSSASLWPPLLPTDMERITLPANLEPNSSTPTSIAGLTVESSSEISSRPPTLPTDIDRISRPVNMACKNDFPPSNLPSAPLTSIPATIPSEATTNGIRAIPMCCSSPTMNKSGGQNCSDSSHGRPIIEPVKGSRTVAIPKSREGDMPTKLWTISTMSNAAQMCILERRLEEDEDHTSNSSSLTTAVSDCPKESCSMVLEPACGANPVSAFYNALYAPDCRLSNTKSLEAHLQWEKRSADPKLRAVLEIALLSAMVTILVFVFYPAVSSGVRSHLYGCCSSCSAVPAAAAASRNPSQHYSQLQSLDGCVYRGRNLWKCPQSQKTTGSTVVK